MRVRVSVMIQRQGRYSVCREVEESMKKNNGFPELSSESAAKYKKLKQILREMGKILVAYSGGVDSSFLLKTAGDVLDGNVLAGIASSETYPKEEKREAVRMARLWGIRYKIIRTDELNDPEFVKNPPTRCYICKKELFSRLKAIAEEEGIPFVCDGTNQEDLGDFRPGLQAARELGIRSPLQEAELLKAEIREISRWIGLPTWNKPSLACFSSRFPYGTKIEPSALEKVAGAEAYLRGLGIRQVRVRHHDRIARIEVESGDMERLLDPDFRRKIASRLKSFGYFYVTVDIEGYRPGSMNEVLGPTGKKRKMARRAPDE